MKLIRIKGLKKLVACSIVMVMMCSPLTTFAASSGLLSTIKNKATDVKDWATYKKNRVLDVRNKFIFHHQPTVLKGSSENYSQKVYIFPSAKKSVSIKSEKNDGKTTNLSVSYKNRNTSTSKTFSTKIPTLKLFQNKISQKSPTPSIRPIFSSSNKSGSVKKNNSNFSGRSLFPGFSLFQKTKLPFTNKTINYNSTLN